MRVNIIHMYIDHAKQLHKFSDPKMLMTHILGNETKDILNHKLRRILTDRMSSLSRPKFLYYAYITQVSRSLIQSNVRSSRRAAL